MMFKRKKPIYEILFVCSGNSCRSPMAEGLMKKRLFAKYGDAVKVHSAGTLGIDDNPATMNAIQVAKEKGVDISAHYSRGIRKTHVADADIIFAMEHHHKEFLERYFPKYRENVFLLKSFANDEANINNEAISDPIGQSLKVYRKIINEIENEINRILPQIEKLIDAKLAME